MALFLRQKLLAAAPSALALRLAQLGLVILFLSLAFSLSLTASEGPDEVAHFYFSRFIAQHGRLPLTPEEQLEAGYKADLPPLFHLMVGLTGQGIDLEAPPYLKISRDNPRLQLVTGHENITAWRVLKTEDPYAGEVLLWQWGRWFTLGCGLAGLALFFAFIHKTQPDRPWLALGAAALLVFLPTYLSISSVTSYEPLVGVLLTGYFLLLFLLSQQPRRRWLFGGAGLLLGLAALTRQTAWPIIPVVPGLILWLALRHKDEPWRETVWRLGLFGVGLLFTFGSWLLYMAVFFNRVAELGWFQGLISPILIGDGSGKTSLQIAGLMTGGGLGIQEVTRQGDSFWQWGWYFFSGLWGEGWLGGLMAVVWLVVLAGLVRRWQDGNGQFRLWLALLAIHLGLFLLLPFVRFLFSGQANTAMSQHLLFPAGAVLLLLLVYGLSAWLKPVYLALLLFGLAGAYLGTSFQTVLNQTDTRLPVQTLPVSNSEQVSATFGTISLIGQKAVLIEDSLQVTLQWRAEEISVEDYRFELRLLDQQNQPQAAWVGHPLNGRYPTRAWAPGDRVREVINLPIAGLAGGKYQLQLGLKGEAGPVASAAGEWLNLEEITLTAPPPFAAGESLALGDQWVDYLLWPDQAPPSKPASYQEHATVLFAAQLREGDNAQELHLKLVGPDNRRYESVARAGHVYNFMIEPGMASGAYRLRAESWHEGQMIAQAETEPLLKVQTEARQFVLAKPISQPLTADFAGYITLLGYDLPQRRTQPGGQIPVTLYWQALRTIGGNLIMFNRLVDEKQQVWGGRDRLIREVYSTMLWAPQEIVTDPFSVQVAPDTPDGIYQLQLGLYLPVGEAAVSLPLRQNGQLSEISHVTVGPIKVGQTPPGLTLAAANPQVSLNQAFGQAGELVLLGYDLKAQDGQTLKLTLYWQSKAPLSRDYTTFVHVLNGAGEIVGQQDRPPLGGVYPTSLWEPGEIIGDELNLTMPEALAPGRYQIIIGMYHLASGERLVIPGSTAHELVLQQIEIGP